MVSTATVLQISGVPLSWFLVLSAVLFSIALVGVLASHNVLMIFMSVELAMNAANIALVSFGVELHSMAGQNFVVFVVAVAAAEAAVGLALVIALVRQKPTLDPSDLDILRE
jgi:NADH-quinone oxidoreductase subunit K